MSSEGLESNSSELVLVLNNPHVQGDLADQAKSSDSDRWSWFVNEPYAAKGIPSILSASDLKDLCSFYQTLQGLGLESLSPKSELAPSFPKKIASLIRL